MTLPAPVRHRPASSATAAVGLAMACGALLLLTGNSWFLLLAGTILGALLMAVLLAPRHNPVLLGIDQPHRMTVGVPTPAHLVATNEGQRTSRPLMVTMSHDGLLDTTAYVGALRPGERVRVPLELMAPRRGAFGACTLRVTVPSPFAVSAHVGKQEGQQPLIVHPALLDVNLPGWHTEESDDTTTVARGPGNAIEGLRDWRFGDGARRVHWRATARHGRLVVVENGSATAERLRLVLIGPSTDPGFELALTQAASWCAAALHEGRGILVAAWTTHGPVCAPTRAPADPLELLDWWASLQQVILPAPERLLADSADAWGSGEVLVHGPASVMTSDYLSRADRHEVPGSRLAPVRETAP